MLNHEERALVTDLQDKIIALLVEKQEARRGVSQRQARHRGDETLARELQRDIDRLSNECAEIRQAAGD